MERRMLIAFVASLLIIPFLPDAWRIGGTRGSGDDEQDHELGPAPDGYYNVTSPDRLTDNWLNIHHHEDPSGDNCIVWSNNIDPTTSQIFLSTYSKDLEPIRECLLIQRCNFNLVAGIDTFEDSLVVYFIEWRFDMKDLLYHSDLKMRYFHMDGSPKTDTILVIGDIAPPGQLPKDYEYQSLQLEINSMSDGKAHLIYLKDGQVRYSLIDENGKILVTMDDLFDVETEKWHQSIHPWMFEPDTLHVVYNALNGTYNKMTIMTDRESRTNITVFDLGLAGYGLNIYPYPGGFSIDTDMMNRMVLDNGTIDERFVDKGVYWDMISQDCEYLYLIPRPQCHHSGSAEMGVVRMFTNGTVDATAPWIRFLEEERMDGYDICHDVQPVNWYQYVNGSHTIFLVVHFLGGLSYMLLKMNGSLKMDAFQFVFPLKLSNVDNYFTDNSPFEPTTGETFEFGLDDIRTDLLTSSVRVEVDFGGKTTIWVPMQGDRSKTGKFEVPSWFIGEMNYRYHFRDQFGCDYTSMWYHKTVIDNDPPELYLGGVKTSVPSGSTFRLNISAHDNIGLGGLIIRYSLGGSDPKVEELLTPQGLGEYGVPVPARFTEIPWEIVIPMDERGPFLFMVELKDVTDYSVMSEDFNVTIVDDTIPSVPMNGTLTVTAGEYFEYTIFAHDNWGSLQYVWKDPGDLPVELWENQVRGSIPNPGTYVFDLWVLDGSGNLVNVSFSIVVVPAEDHLFAPTGLNIFDNPGSDGSSVNSRDQVDWKPHYWGGPPPEDEGGAGSEKEKMDLTPLIFIALFMAVFSTIAVLFAFAKKLQEKDDLI